ncbi:MAG: EpsG family protein [Lachnospiraceae bacterium]|nr:EpsG family protein [Lachnospiraceae bacterium]
MELSTINKSKKKRYLIFALVPVFALIAFKDQSVGADTSTYMMIFDTVKTFKSVDVVYSDTTVNVEIGYKYLIYFLSKFFTDGSVVLYILGAFVCIALYFFITKTAKNYCLALYFFITLGFFQFAMSGIRQTIAICIVLLGYEYIKKRNLGKFILIIALAMTFHKSALVVLPAYFLSNWKISLRNTIFLMAGMSVILLFADKLLISVADVMEYNYGIEGTGNGYIFFVIVFIITLLCLISKRTLLKQNSANSILLNINFISLALWCVRLISRTAERVSLYFMPYTYVALEEYITSVDRDNRKFYLVVSILLAGILCLYRLSGQPELSEFKFCFHI